MCVGHSLEHVSGLLKKLYFWGSAQIWNFAQTLGYVFGRENMKKATIVDHYALKNELLIFLLFF